MSSCHICSQELISIELYVQDRKIKPCHVCLAVIAKTVEQLERRQMAKEKRKLLWHNETTGEYSLDEFDEDDLLEEDDTNEYLDGFHFVEDQEEENYE